MHGAPVHDDGPRRKPCRTVKFMRRQNDRCTRSHRSAQHSVDLITSRSVEACMRFVEQPQFRPPHDEGCERATPALAGGHSTCAHIGQTAIDAHPLHRRVHFPAGRSDRRRPEAHVLTGREVEIQPVRVTEESDTPADALPICCDIHPEHGPAAPFHREKTGAHAQETCLPRAVRSAQKHDLPLFRTEVRTCECREPPENRNNAAKVDDGAHTTNDASAGVPGAHTCRTVHH